MIDIKISSDEPLKLESEDLRVIRGMLEDIDFVLKDIQKILKLQTTTTLTLEDPDKTGLTLFSEFENRVGCGKSTDHLEPLSKPKTGAEDEAEAPTEKETESIEEQVKEHAKGPAKEPVDAGEIIALSKELIALGKPEVRSRIKEILKKYGLTRVSQADTLTDKERAGMYAALQVLDLESCYSEEAN